MTAEASAPAYARPGKVSLTLRGHRTSVSLEPAFWAAFRRLAARRGMTPTALAAEIDAARPPGVGLAGAMRLAVLADLEERAGEGRAGRARMSAGSSTA